MNSIGKRIIKFRSKSFNDYIAYLTGVRFEKDVTTITAPVYVVVFVYHSGRISDIDNILKVLFDALQYSHIIENDRQIKKLLVELKKSPRIEAYLDLAIHEY